MICINEKNKKRENYNVPLISLNEKNKKNLFDVKNAMSADNFLFSLAYTNEFSSARRFVIFFFLILVGVENEL
jgi:hypothetical protein